MKDQNGGGIFIIERKYVALLVVIAAVAVACVVYGLYSFRTRENTQEQIRDAVMAYVKSKHPETAQYMNSLSWTGGNITPKEIVGASTYSYKSDGWNVTMEYPVVPNAIYSITANYTKSSLTTQITIAWQGTWQNGAITETGYNYTP
jgi:uncharacterized membrane protein